MRGVHAVGAEGEGGGSSEHAGVGVAAAAGAAAAADAAAGERAGGRQQRHTGSGGGGEAGGARGAETATAASKKEDEEVEKRPLVVEMRAAASTLQKRKTMRQKKHEAALLEHLLQEIVSLVYECKESLDELPLATATRAGGLYTGREEAGARGGALEAAAAAYEDEEEAAAKRTAAAAGPRALTSVVGTAARRNDAAAATADAHDPNSGEWRGGGGRRYAEEEEHRISSGEFRFTDAYDFFSSPRRDAHGARHEGGGGGGEGDEREQTETLARQLHAFITRCLIPSVERTKGQAAALRASHANVSEKLQRFEDIVERQTEQLEELQQDLHAKKESDVLRQKNLAVAMEGLREENEELRSQVAAVERALVQQRQEKVTLEQRLQQALQQQEKHRQKSDSTSSESTVSDLSSELASARRELKRLAIAATQKDSLIEDLKAALAAKHEDVSARSTEPFAPLLPGQPLQSRQGVLHRRASSKSSVDSSDRSSVPRLRSPSSSEVQKKRRPRHKTTATAAGPLPDRATGPVSADPSVAATAAALGVASCISSAPADERATAAAVGHTQAPAGSAAAADDAGSMRRAFLAGHLISPRGAALSFLSGNRAVSQRKHISELMQQQQQKNGSTASLPPHAPALRPSLTLASELGSDFFAVSSPQSCLSTSRREYEAEKRRTQEVASSEKDGVAAERTSLEDRMRERREGDSEPEQHDWRQTLQQSEQQRRAWQQLQQEREQQQMATEEVRERLEKQLSIARREAQQLAGELPSYRQEQKQQLRDTERRRRLLQQQIQQELERWERQLMRREEERQEELQQQVERQQHRDTTQCRQDVQKAHELQERLHMQLEDQRVRQEDQVMQFRLKLAETRTEQRKVEPVSARNIETLKETVAMLKKALAEAVRDKTMQQERYLAMREQMREVQDRCADEERARRDLTQRLDEHQRRSGEQQQKFEREQQQRFERQQQQIREQRQRLEQRQKEVEQQQQQLEQRQMGIEERNQQQSLEQQNEVHQQVLLQRTQESCECLRMRTEQLQQRLDDRERQLEEQRELLKRQQDQTERQQRELLQDLQTQKEKQVEEQKKLLEEELKKRQQLQQEIDKLHYAHDILQQQRRQLQQQLELREHDLHQQQQIEEHGQHSGRQQPQQEHQQRQLEQQQQQLEQQQQQLERQQQQLKEQQPQLAEQRQGLDEQQSKKRELEKELEEQRRAQQQTMVLQGQLETAEPERREKEESIALAEALLVEKGEEVETLQEKLTRISREMGSDTESLRDRLREALAANERDAKALAALRVTRDAEVKAAAKLSEEAAAALEQLQTRHDVLEKAFSASQEEVSSLRNVCDTLKKELRTSKMKREKEFESYKHAIKLRNAERKNQVQQMLEVNESLAMRKEEVETRLTDQLQEFQNDIYALIRLHMQNLLLRRSASQRARDGVQQPPLSSSFATRVWHAYDQKLSESLELTDRSGSIRSTRRSGRPVDLYRPVALSIRSLRPHSRREGGNELDQDEARSQLSREDSGTDEGRGEKNVAMLDFLPSFMVKLRDKLFSDDSQQLSSYRQRPQLQPTESTEDSDAVRLTRRWQVRRGLAISTPVATPISSARSAGVANGRGRYRRCGNGNRAHKLPAEKRPEHMESRDINNNKRQIL